MRRREPQRLCPLRRGIAVHHRIGRRRDRFGRQRRDLDRRSRHAHGAAHANIRQRDVDVEIRRDIDLRVGPLHRFDARARELELRRPALRRLESGRAGELELAVASAAGRVERERAAVAAPRRRFDSVDYQAPRRHRDAAAGPGAAPVERRLGNRSADVEVERHRAGHLAEVRGQQREEREVRPLQRDAAGDRRVALAHVVDLALQIRVAAVRARDRRVDRELAGLERRARARLGDVGRERLGLIERDAHVRRAARQHGRAMRLPAQVGEGRGHLIHAVDLELRRHDRLERREVEILRGDHEPIVALAGERELRAAARARYVHHARRLEPYALAATLHARAAPRDASCRAPSRRRRTSRACRAR